MFCQILIEKLFLFAISDSLIHTIYFKNYDSAMFYFNAFYIIDN